jgi:hypothetical protein
MVLSPPSKDFFLPSSSVFVYVMCAAGGTLAVLAERLYLFDLLGGGLEDSRCVNGGLIIAEQIGKLYVIGRKLAFESTLATGQIGKVFDIISDERIDSCSTIRVTSRLAAGLLLNTSSASASAVSASVSSGVALTATEEQQSQSQTNKTRPHRNPKDIFLDDDITAATTDLHGKKLFIGTHSGKILLLDTTTVGILNHLTYSETQEARSRETQGPVVTMKYCNQNELLVVAHTSGVVKIFCGCHRTITLEQRETYLMKNKMIADPDISTGDKESDKNPPGLGKGNNKGKGRKREKEWCPYSLGGNTPSSPMLLRSNQSTHETTVLTMAVSEELGLIAVSGVDGTGSHSFLPPSPPLHVIYPHAPPVCLSQCECLICTLCSFGTSIALLTSLGNLWNAFIFSSSLELLSSLELTVMPDSLSGLSILCSLSGSSPGPSLTDQN